MSATKLVTILVVFGIGAFVLISSIYTVSEVEQAIITQFGEPVGAPVTAAGLKDQGALHPGRQPDRQACSRVGRQSVRYANQGQALCLGRPLRPLADCRSFAVLSTAAR